MDEFNGNNKNNHVNNGYGRRLGGYGSLTLDAENKILVDWYGNCR